MEKLAKSILLTVVLIFCSCKEENKVADEVPATQEIVEEKKSARVLKEELTSRGFQIFDYVDEETKDTVLMQQYYIAFLKRGSNTSQSKEEADSLQGLHMAHLASMYEQGFADISGPFGEDGEIRGITIYNVPSKEIADSLANSDPMVKAGRLKIEIHPWWAAKGFSLR